MSEDLPGKIENTPSYDENVESSTTTEAKVETEGQPQGQPEGETEASATETPEAKKPNKVQERINQLTREKHEAKQKNADLEKRLQALESKPAEVKEEPLVAPKEDSYENYSDYQEARDDYITDRATKAAYDKLSSENKTRDSQTQETERQGQLKVKRDAFNANLDTKRDSFEDWDEVAMGHQFMDLDLGEQIIDMGDKAPEIAYHLGSHLDVAERIFNLSPVERARELTRLEFTLEPLKAKTVSTAPDPITPLGNSESIEFDETKLSNEEWQEWRNKKQHG